MYWLEPTTEGSAALVVEYCPWNGRYPLVEFAVVAITFWNATGADVFTIKDIEATIPKSDCPALVEPDFWSIPIQ